MAGDVRCGKNEWYLVNTFFFIRRFSSDKWTLFGLYSLPTGMHKRALPGWSEVRFLLPGSGKEILCQDNPDRSRYGSEVRGVGTPVRCLPVVT